MYNFVFNCLLVYKNVDTRNKNFIINNNTIYTENSTYQTQFTLTIKVDFLDLILLGAIRVNDKYLMGEKFE
jgi:hypothetical protein